MKAEAIDRKTLETRDVTMLRLDLLLIISHLCTAFQVLLEIAVSVFHWCLIRPKRDARCRSGHWPGTLQVASPCRLVLETRRSAAVHYILTMLSSVGLRKRSALGMTSDLVLVRLKQDRQRPDAFRKGCICMIKRPGSLLISSTS
jgi:hypothetical protein